MNSPNLSLPYLEAAQAQKHVTHNDALSLIDALTHLSFASSNASEPPALAEEGACILVGQTPSGAFAGHAGMVAIFDGGAWRFVEPRRGWRAFAEDDNNFLLFDGSTWLPVENLVRQLADLDNLGVGTQPDLANPFAAKVNSALFTARGTSEAGNGDLRLTLNKETDTHTVSQLYQSAYAGRAETGLIGDDSYRVKVSADGLVWKDALVVDPATGKVAFPSGVSGPGAGLQLKRIEVFSSSGTFEKAAGEALYFVQVVGGGGGGGSGARSVAGGLAGGGAGGNGGGCCEGWFPADAISQISSVVVGDGGLGGSPAQIGSAGAAGAFGTSSNFGNVLIAYGGIGGAAGELTGGGPGRFGQADIDSIPPARVGGAAGGGAGAGVGSANSNRTSGGGGGGGVSAVNVAYPGGAAGPAASRMPFAISPGGAAGAVAASGGAGIETSPAYGWGSGGGGGGGAVSGPSGNGGVGGDAGGGGGGGGGGRNGFAGGAGGAGGRGQVRVFAYG